MKNNKERKTVNSIILFSWIILNFILFFFVGTINAQNKTTLVPQDLKCEYRVNPEGIDIITPRLSWSLFSNLKGDNQTAYRVLVASSLAKLEENNGDLWDTRKVLSSQTLHIPYGGRVLNSKQTVWWKVQVWNTDNEPSPWSEPAKWSMGLLKENDWEAYWISNPQIVLLNPDSLKKNKTTKSLPATYLRKEFDISSSVKKATAYISAKGLYEIFINGEKVGNQYLSPEWTSYRQRISYQSFDVTKFIKKGKNAVGAILGEGWFAGDLFFTGRFAYGHYTSFLGQIEIELDDGKRVVIVTDEYWRSTIKGPIIQSSIYHGEHYDSNLDQSGWNNDSFDDSTWDKVFVEKVDPTKMVWLRNEPIKEELRVYPKEITEPLKNVYVVDFGQNMVGWCRIFGNAKKAENIIIQYGEALNEDGTLYTENLRGAQQTDIYKPSNNGIFVFEPRFTYHGFRYIQIHGLSDKPIIDSIFGRVIHSSSPFVSNFQCSDSSLNKLMENIRWTQRGNLMSSPNDCPQRDERFGWLGDIQIFAQTGIFNMDLAAFLTKFLTDTRDDQADDGRFPDFAPHPGNPNLDFSGAPGWGDAAVFIPWITYVNYADEQILKEQFSAACRWIKYIHRNNPDYIWRNGRNRDYNDWLNGDKIIHEEWPKEGAEVPNEIFATAFFYKSTQIVAKMADIIHRPVESKYYGQLADSIKTAFIKNFVKEDGFITGNTQAGYALALNFKLLPPEQRSNALEHMIKNIRKDYNGHLSTGIQTSVRALLELTSMERNNLAWELILNRTFPSWMYMIDNGATSIWERWDGYVKGRGFQSPGMNSLNHWALGAVGEWMWKNIIGLNPDENQPGWKHFTISPKPGGGLNWAKGDYLSIRGRILSSWEIRDKKFFLEIEVPPNCTATVQIPTTDVNNITMDGNSIKAESYKEGFAGFKVLSGKYSFVSPY